MCSAPLTEDGPYTFQELHYYRDDASLTHLTGIKSFSFDLNPGAEANTTTGLLKLTKGLFVKFYCIANRTQLYGVDATGALQPYDYFSSLVQTAPGQSANTVTPGVPTETDFLKLQTQLINPEGATENDIFVSPLPYDGCLHYASGPDGLQQCHPCPDWLPPLAYGRPLRHRECCRGIPYHR